MQVPQRINVSLYIRHRQILGWAGDPDDTHSRYIEALIDGVFVDCLYLPNGNPAPGPKFDYKLRWFERLTEHAEAHASVTEVGGERIVSSTHSVPI